MKNIITTKNPFLTPLGGVNCGGEMGHELKSYDNGNTWFYSTACSQVMHAGEIQVFDEQGRYHFEIRHI